MSGLRVVITGGASDAGSLREQVASVPSGPWECLVLGNAEQAGCVAGVRVHGSTCNVAQLRSGLEGANGPVIWLPSGRVFCEGGVAALAAPVMHGGAHMVVGTPADIGGRGTGIRIPDFRIALGTPIDYEVCALSAGLVAALPPPEVVGRGVAGAALALAVLNGGLVLWDSPVASPPVRGPGADEEQRLASDAQRVAAALDVLNGAPDSDLRRRDLPYVMSLAVSRFAPLARERNRRVLSGLRPRWSRD